MIFNLFLLNSNSCECAQKTRAKKAKTFFFYGVKISGVSRTKLDISKREHIPMSHNSFSSIYFKLRPML